MLEKGINNRKENVHFCQNAPHFQNNKNIFRLLVYLLVNFGFTHFYRCFFPYFQPCDGRIPDHKTKWGANSIRLVRLNALTPTEREQCCISFSSYEFIWKCYIYMYKRSLFGCVQSKKYIWTMSNNPVKCTLQLHFSVSFVEICCQ